MKVILDWDKKYKKGIIVSDFLDVIREHFSIKNPNARVLQRIIGFHAPLRQYAITNNGRFEFGLYFDIIRFLKTQNLTCEIITTDILKELLCSNFNLKNNEIKKLSLPLRYYQENAVQKCIKFGYGNIIVGTAGGKTLLMASLIETIRNNSSKLFTTLLILPAHLVEQTYKDFINYGIPKEKISQWSGDHKFEKQDIIIVSSKTLESCLVTFKNLKLSFNTEIEAFKDKEKERMKKWKCERTKYLQLLNNVDLLLIDECHTLRKNNKINKILNFFPTQHKFGFTGTMPESLLDQWNIIGKIGPILEDVSSYKLREEGFISKAHSTILQITYKNPINSDIDFKKPTEAYKQECNFIFENEYRNKIISYFAEKFDNNILILVNQLKHGEILLELLKKNIPQKGIFFVRGSMITEERENIRQLMENVDNVVCIAMSKIFSTGINITNIHCIIFALAGKAKIRMLQSIGRGLRLHEKKDTLEIIDIVDNLRYSLLHFNRRMMYYDKEKINYETKLLSE